MSREAGESVRSLLIKDLRQTDYGNGMRNIWKDCGVIYRDISSRPWEKMSREGNTNSLVTGNCWLEVGW